MKKYTPYIFPLIVIIIVFFLVYRWYSLRTQRDSSASDLGSDIQIEELSPDQLDSVLRGTADVSTTQLEPSEDSDSTMPAGRGTIRYTVEDGKVNFTVSADLPDSESVYRVWVRSEGEDDLTQAFMLEAAKGGYMGSASISQNELPLEIVVSTAAEKSEVMNAVILKGTIAAPEVTASPSASPAMEEAN